MIITIFISLRIFLLFKGELTFKLVKYLNANLLDWIFFANKLIYILVWDFVWWMQLILIYIVLCGGNFKPWMRIKFICYTKSESELFLYVRSLLNHCLKPVLIPNYLLDLWVSIWLFCSGKSSFKVIWYICKKYKT